MTKITIGYLHSSKILNKEDEIFLKKANELNVDLIPLNISKEFTESDFEKIRKCDVIYNNSGEEFAIDFIKAFEKIGKKVIESSKAYYYDEDKWKFMENCMENDIPVPKTILLSEDTEIAKKQLIEFNNWPVILKRVKGTWGEYVMRAENSDNAIEVMNRLWDKGGEKLPIIAQEFVDSFSYRVTFIGKKIVQTAIKENNNWKCTGVYAKNFKKIDVDENLKQIIEKIMGSIDIKVCGVDLLKRNNDWLVIEANSEPALDFFENEKEYLIEEILKMLIKSFKRSPPKIEIIEYSLPEMKQLILKENY